MRTHMKLKSFGLFTIIVLLFAFPAYAMDLQQARNAGLVGEQLSGYVVALKESPEIMALVKEVNAWRRQEYVRISNENKQPLEVIAKIYAEQIISGLEPGNLYQAAGGAWKAR